MRQLVVAQDLVMADSWMWWMRLLSLTGSLAGWLEKGNVTSTPAEDTRM